MFLDPYVAVYLSEEENQLVKIIRVLHHKQDYPALF
ncbi:type II toxin-antitoxin system RelE/ParE family toxin [Enterococcus sp. 669A]|uniref:Type II toxin-antitoxin system RelE/ParE family toxin n=1 Tax=Candidatus Enterococcus moelleringii TaxID=2815325 RepID=A0ABS3LEN0_9ENTE|nr:type II toxin-antitoxin system RelE/ParE family toxin [Enterococcus sp. 669A]